MKLQIFPGAMNIATDDILQPQYRSLRKQSDLPPKGGVGEIPLKIRHQHKLPICTGEAGAYLRAITWYQEHHELLDFSGMFIYKMNRDHYDGLAKSAKGSTLKATMQTLQKKGVCTERAYQSNAETLRHPFPYRNRFGKMLFLQAKQYCIRDFARCCNLEDILFALADQKPVIFSMIIYTDFYDAQKGVVRDHICGQKIGGHSMVAMNYDLENEYIQVVQSWGRDMKGPTDNGYMYIPFSWFRETTSEGNHLLIEAFVAIG